MVCMCMGCAYEYLRVCNALTPKAMVAAEGGSKQASAYVGLIMLENERVVDHKDSILKLVWMRLMNHVRMLINKHRSQFDVSLK